MKRNEYFYITQYLSLNNSLFYNNDFILSSNKKDIENIFINIEKLENKYKIDNLEIVQLLYFNRVSINKILYDKDEIITLNSEDISNLSYYFYVSLLTFVYILFNDI